MKYYLLLALACAISAVSLTLSSCSEESDVVSRNISTAAHRFEVPRRAIFYNGITGEYILTVEGYLTVKEGTQDRRLEVTVQTGPNEYKKHYLGLSDNVTYFVEQLESIETSSYRYKVMFRPTTIIPDIDADVR